MIGRMWSGTARTRFGSAMLLRALASSMCLLFVLGCLGGAWAGDVAPQTAAQGQPTPASWEELQQWRDEIWANTRNQPIRNNPEETYDPNGSATYLIQLDSYTIESQTPSLDAEHNPILSVTLNDVHADGPRGTGLGMTIDEVLATYQNNNPQLLGSSEFAALYVYDENARPDVPEAAWGLLMRNQSDAQSVEYVVSKAYGEADAYSNIMISYVITGGFVTDMKVSGFEDSVLAEELKESIATIQRIVADVSFDPQASNQPPQQAEMFRREDLVFSGVDFLVETVEDVRTLLGAPKNESVAPSEDGSTTTTHMEYPGVNFDFTQTDDQHPPVLNALQITGLEFEGPRGLHIGDTLDEVLQRFRMEERTYQEPSTILYAPGESVDKPPFGLLEVYGEQEATIRYAMPGPSGEENQAVMLLVTVEGLHVTEMYLYRWKVE